MSWEDEKSKARNAQAAASAKRTSEDHDTFRRSVERRTPSREALDLQPDFNGAVAEFVRLMPRSKSEKETRNGLAGWLPRKRFFYLRDVQASQEEISRLGRTAFVGAHIFVDGQVRTFGMGLERDLDARISKSAMVHVMKLMAAELAIRRAI